MTTQVTQSGNHYSLAATGDKPNQMAPTRVNGTRLMNSIHDTCDFGKAHPYGTHHTETGMARLVLNDDDKKVREWLAEQVKAVGFSITVDEMGNMFSVRPGKNKTAPPVMMGSHLDTQPTGGREEVARFPIVTVSSGVWAGTIPLGKAWNCREVTSKEVRTMKQELERIGFLGQVLASYTAQPIAAHFELHIEQGPILENEKQKIGVVTGGQAYNLYELVVRGRDSHSATTPYFSRKDALLAAAKMVAVSNKVAKDAAGLITTGIFDFAPGSINTMTHTLFDSIAKEESELGVEVSWTTLTENAAVVFHPDCVAAVEQSSEELTASGDASSKHTKLWGQMLSGAGHDSCNTNKRCPSAMIFTPTRNGMSHTPNEYCSPEDCTLGAEVLMGAALKYDALRAQRGVFD
ncbi:uncharacterized protein KD926_002326 [Aspergillus affinis]|uniref:uncharacterized protein n=1 Tax=Aspergillus affinis TaxID=1070780 RepID=UPI0022FE5F97|nr:uncharacterized protein KD926_002326 [Aspergillus affinis]KAI9043947.1 hypothetical protein KD926_002326 [Aspergillus affinis]